MALHLAFSVRGISITGLFRVRRASPSFGIITLNPVHYCKFTNETNHSSQLRFSSARCNLKPNLKQHAKGQSGGCFNVKHLAEKSAFIMNINATPLSTVRTTLLQMLLRPSSLQWGPLPRLTITTSLVNLKPKNHLIGCFHFGTDSIHGCPLFLTPGLLFLCSVGLPLDTGNKERGKHRNVLRCLSRDKMIEKRELCK